MKMKTYDFSLKGFQTAKYDRIMDKVGFSINCSFYGIMGVLLILDVIGSKFIVSYIGCTGVSKGVKWMVNKGII